MRMMVNARSKMVKLPWSMRMMVFSLHMLTGKKGISYVLLVMDKILDSNYLLFIL
jgi:hypothetical protein